VDEPDVVNRNDRQRWQSGSAWWCGSFVQRSLFIAKWFVLATEFFAKHILGREVGRWEKPNSRLFAFT
jgi:hypothetical protein